MESKRKMRKVLIKTEKKLRNEDGHMSTRHPQKQLRQLFPTMFSTVSQL